MNGGQPTSDGDAYASSSPSSSSSQQGNNRQQRTPTGLPPPMQQQLTRQEYEAMSKINERVQKVRSVGFFAGAASTYLFLHYRKRTNGYLRTFGYCTMGAIVLSTILQPIAILASSGDLKKVENPQHLAEVLKSAKEARETRRSGIPPPGQMQPGQMPPSQMQPGQMPPSQMPPMQRPQQPRTDFPRAPSGSEGSARINQWGDEVGSAPSNDFASAPSSDQLPQAGSSQGPSQGGSSSYNSNPPPQQASQSRWGQLRGERNVQESSWDKIRQQNAREAYNRQSNNGQGQSAYSQEGGIRSGGEYGGQQDGGLADPSFGKGMSASRSQAQEEYEKSFERERRGIDGRGTF
ncbi:hypothetical protein CBS101457_002849 [Exobasidium rhododendri]|nr:hypothetical protein CBS101457_002849 [Exobasidium rhododendri]